MNGSTHKAIGFAAGASLALYAVCTYQPLIALGAVTAPMGAMLPDIDHHNTKLGRTKDAVFAFIKKVARIVMIAAMALAVLSLVIPKMSTVIPLCLITVCVGLFINIALSKTLAEKIPFLTKHRGIMHTLLLPVVLLIAGRAAQNVVVRSLIVGLVIGYITHLYADSLTVMGSPLAWPISQECVGLKVIRTGSVWEYVAAAIMSIVMIVYAILLSKNAWYAIFLHTIVIVPACRILTRKILQKGKSQKTKRVKVILTAAVTVICLLLIMLCEINVKVLVGSVLSGVFIGVADTVKISRR